MTISSQEQRRAVCFHIAGRAVIHALAGAHVYRVAVAPIHSPNWTYEPRKGSVLTGFDGYCEASDVPQISQSVVWSDKDGRFVGDREKFEDIIEQSRAAFNLLKPEFRKSEFPASAEQYLEQWRDLVRAHVAARWAGPMAQLIQVHGRFDEKKARGDSEFEHDISVADGMFQLLPENELSRILHITETSLREPGVWQQVGRLADALGRLGEVGRGLNEYLPESAVDWMRRLAPEAEVAGLPARG
ncbi:hypothetical protein L0Z42_18485 [Burkholderia multivorans]|uniref:hypothetical protein n=1 Tax=Burkholderia multivorans TaxID=87883 RepID=UPI00201987A7|nr:hypothetical protein [Burkholderia multivorans]MCO1372488.1 hypothetical protein [Burkholderia multivorans]MCO1456267.1 hypothetical protein [Burkholderia multivorans]MCO1465248.1 hypothetical protein [Burkholderia multivorans]UQO17009.1 hypothetical protein L0Z02_15850 [Burkholderia multivorans]UQO85612.1 hypothetical protein L0Y86_10555 [Burkholderia multivorans]